MKLTRFLVLLITALLLINAATVAQLQASFTADKTGGCSPMRVLFTNTSSGASANAVYTWDLGNGNTSSSANAGAIYQEEKTYTVTLTVQDAGNTSVKTQTISVYAKPVVTDITVAPVKGCLPLNATFSAAAMPGSGSISSYFWDFGDGNTQQGFFASQQHIYTVQQKASVSLTVTNNFGCTNTLQKKDIVEIVPALNASFSASQTILCHETDAVQFVNNSSGPGTLTYLWDFGDGTTSTQKAPAHAFSKKGIYTVTLTVNSSEGCVVSSTQAGYINVASFSTDFLSPSLVCKGSLVSFSNISQPGTPNTYWEVDGNPVYNYYYNYIDYSFSSLGSHTVKLKNLFGACPDSTIKTVVVQDIPYPNGFVDTVLGNCGSPVIVNFKDTTAGAIKWAWNFTSYYNGNIESNQQAPSHTFTQDGIYYVYLTVSNAAGCSATISKYVSILRPAVSISVNKNAISCGPVSLVFTANASEEITAYNWKFSDGASSTAAQPEHLFSAPGYGNAILDYTTKSGCTGTVSYGGIEVYSKPVADFSTPVTTICGNTPVSFYATPQPGNTYYYWYFGDDVNPTYSYYGNIGTHQYGHDSTYSVTLIVTNQGNCRDTLTKKDFIKILPPFPKITGAVNTCNDTRGLVAFTQASKKADTWTWDFGDGSSSTLNTDQPGITHTYTKTGSYKTVLITTNGQCAVRDSIFLNVLLKQNPMFTLDKNEICAGQPFNFQINNVEPSPIASSYYYNYYFVKWQYEDNSLFNGSYSTANYANYWASNTAGTANSYNTDKNNIRVIFRSAIFGCEDTSNFAPIAFKGAIAGFAVVTDKQCWRQPVILTDTSKTIGSSKIVRWDWSFGDGASQSSAVGGTVSHQYLYPGIYNVTLNVTDAGGCSSAAFTKSVQVNGPKAAFYPSPASTTITLPVYFYNNTNNYNSNNTQYQWQFGDGSLSTDFNPSHAYALPGDYTVRLIAMNPITLCGDTVYQSVHIINFSPAFTLSSSNITGKCPPVVVRFSNNSFNYTSVTWNFGDGNTADNLNYPSHVYEKPGRYIVTLYVYGPSGLKATYIDSVLIKQPASDLHTDTSELCIGGKADLTATVNNMQTALWDFGDGTLLATIDTSASHQYMTAGVYKPAIMATNSDGCSILTALNTTINVHPNPVIKFSPAQPIVCKGSSVQLTATGGVLYAWMPATGLNNPAVASPYASPDTSTSYQVAVKDDIGCTNKAVVKVIVGQPFTLKAASDTSICLGKSILLPVSGASTYKWIGNTGGLNNTVSATPVAMPVATTTYTVTGTDQYNCFTDTTQVTVKVMPLPNLNAVSGQEVQVAAPVQLSAVSDNNIVQWNWSPAQYLNCTDCPAPISTPLAQTTYTVTVKNKNGCIASDTVIIKVQCQESTVRIPNAFTPNNDNTNDVFMIKGISLVKHLVIYDRWGEKVFERSNFVAGDRSACWNGTYKGSPATAGSYIYYAEMQCPTGGSFVMKGAVVLIR